MADNTKDENSMDTHEITVKFRYVPCIFFKCILCSHTIQVERSLPDIAATSVECQGCHNAYYQAIWGMCPDETRVIEKWGLGCEKCS